VELTKGKNKEGIKKRKFAAAKVILKYESNGRVLESCKVSSIELMLRIQIMIFLQINLNDREIPA
jgi:hypothetical protein